MTANKLKRQNLQWGKRRIWGKKSLWFCQRTKSKNVLNIMGKAYLLTWFAKQLHAWVMKYVGNASLWEWHHGLSYILNRCKLLCKVQKHTEKAFASSLHPCSNSRSWYNLGNEDWTSSSARFQWYLGVTHIIKCIDFIADCERCSSATGNHFT